MKLILSIFILLYSYTAVYAQPPTIISGVINSYAKVTSVDYCSKTLGVTTTAGFAVGDKAIIIQMKGAGIDTANSSGFGDITSINEAGNFEFVTVESITANTIKLKYLLVQNYNPNGAVQLVRVPRYITAWVQGSPLTAPAWDGSTGGVLALEASGAVDINNGSSITMTGKGFRGGTLNPGSFIQYNTTEYSSALLSNKGGGKGESITEPDSLRTASRGAAANGGGGGNQHNAGGGGGANGGAGGMGGREFANSPTALINGGIGGHKLDFKGKYPKIFMGGGGGAGHQNDGVGTAGVAGGGIVIIKSGVLVGRGNIIAANGNSQTLNSINDGAGGGGGGGSIFLDVERITSPVLIEAKGGNGGNVNIAQPHGPGGGGGGGLLAVNSTLLLDSINASLNGGNPGVILNTTNTYAAETGQTGRTAIGLIIPEGNAIPVIAQVAKDTTICPGSAASIGKTAIGGRPPYTYSWSPSLGLDNSTAEFPNASPPVSTLYTVTVTDSTGCKSYAQVYVRLHEKQIISAGVDTAVCLGSSVQLLANGRGTFQWTPQTGLNNPLIANPIATPTQTTNYRLVVTDSNGCTSEDSINVMVYPLPGVILSTIDTSICAGDSISIVVSGTSGTAPYTYKWSPSSGVSDVTSAAPIFSPASTSIYTVTVLDAHGCSVDASVNVRVNQLPLADAGTDIAVCSGDTVVLSAKGGIGFAWNPSTGLSSASIANPRAYPNQTTTYYLTVTNQNGCKATDSVKVTVHPLPSIPVLTLATDTIFSSVKTPVTQYSWFLDGVQIPTEKEPTLIAVESGNYTLSIVDTNGCRSTSLPIDVTLGSGVLTTDNLCASPGEVIDIPLRLLSGQRIGQTRATDIEMSLRFNASILLPLDKDFLENRVVNGERIIHLRVPVIATTTDLLRSLKFAVALGDDTATTIRITDYTSIGGRIRLSDSVSNFCVLGICRDGGVRLYRADGGNAALSVTSTLPTQPEEHITITTVENGMTKLSLINILGQTVATLLNDQLPIGERSIELDISTLNAGTYLLVLQTPSEYITRILNVGK